ncbi:hypothetical protein NOCA1240138 [metagenome]|uniref:Uncharacterized protein n=1 Tax=metagenome TaxID=256318 RepID=A0A2P2CGA1_9ZZZZ
MEAGPRGRVRAGALHAHDVAFAAGLGVRRTTGSRRGTADRGARPHERRDRRLPAGCDRAVRGRRRPRGGYGPPARDPGREGLCGGRAPPQRDGLPRPGPGHPVGLRSTAVAAPAGIRDRSGEPPERMSVARFFCLVLLFRDGVDHQAGQARRCASFGVPW